MTTKEKIKQYYKNTQSELKVLDKGIPQQVYSQECYNAVSLSYIHKYVIKEKVTKRFVARKMFELCKENFLLPIPCGHAGDLVFCRFDWAKDKYFTKFDISDKGVVVLGWLNTYYEDNEWVKTFNKFL